MAGITRSAADQPGGSLVASVGRQRPSAHGPGITRELPHHAHSFDGCRLPDEIVGWFLAEAKHTHRPGDSLPRSLRIAIGHTWHCSPRSLAAGARDCAEVAGSTAPQTCATQVGPGTEQTRTRTTRRAWRLILTGLFHDQAGDRRVDMEVRLVRVPLGVEYIQLVDATRLDS